MTTDSKYLISSKDIGLNLVPKSYVIDRYPYMTDLYRFAGLWSWGYNTQGELGDNTTTGKSIPVQTITYGSKWKLVSGGGYHTAAVKTDGTLWTWGFNNNGQLGDNTITQRSSPVQTVTFDTNWKLVACGNYHTAAIKTDGTLWTWGQNNNGQLGDNTTTNRSSPVQTVTFGTNWKLVSCGRYYTAAIKTDGTLWSWGNNSNAGSLGDNTRTNRSSPVQTVTFGTNWKLVSCGREHTAAIKTDGTLWTWGRNAEGQLGDNTTTGKSSPVQTVTFATNWKLVSGGSYNTVAIKTDGTLWTWGRNNFGQIGDNTTTHRSSPVQTVTFGTNWKYVSGGDRYTAAIKNDGTLWTWGFNSNGMLGDNTTTNKSSPVQTVTFGTNWKSVACSNYHMSAIKTDGTLWLWGYNNSGQLGDNTTTNKSSPIQTVAFGTNWKSVSSGGSNTAAIKTDGTLWIWGANSNGTLGDNTSTDKSSPVQTVAYGTNWKFVSAGNAHIAAIKTDGTLWTWGRNSFGTLGDNTTTYASSPIQTIAYGINWKSVSAGKGFHTTAIKDNSSDGW